tara:strand:+ start:303 stop:599 length:297 start_codon:yes stop_codon:yes gene_type:complete
MLDSDFIIKPKKYKFNENKILKEIMEYIDSTYCKHYSNGEYQATDMIIDSGHGEGFCIGNIMKYAMRYGKKASKKSELAKIIHYSIIALYLIERNDNG